jgi:serine phosphatase RsbU (regulator of sigma subunit)
MPTLQIISGLNTGEQHTLGSREILLGRHPDCQVVLRDSTVSRRHARISYDGSHYVLHDVGSQHGTRVNGELIRLPHRLRHGDEIQLSQVTIVYVDEMARPEEHPSTIVTSVDVLGSAQSVTETHTAPKWRALLEITRSLGVSLDLETILPKVLENVFSILPQATRGWILVSQKPGDGLKPYAARQIGQDEPPAMRISRTITEKVLHEGKAILSTDAGQDERFLSSDSVLELNMRSILCAPLVGVSREPLGMIQLDAQDQTRQFTPEDLDVLVNIANLVGQAVEHARLHETALQFDRRERDLATARQVQQHFLPQERPTLVGYELFDYYHPADVVGGDYFGYTPLPDGRLAIAVGDVAGHGVPAALLMARLCADARYCLVTTPVPRDAVRMLNRQLTRQNLNFFITFALCVVDPARNELLVVNAGHMQPMLRRAATGEVHSLGADIARPPLGIDANINYEQLSLTLEPGDVLMMYTDGLSEARDNSGDVYGTDRIQEIMSRPHHAEELVRELLGDVRDFALGSEQEDDVCIVILSRKPS